MKKTLLFASLLLGASFIVNAQEYAPGVAPATTATGSAPQFISSTKAPGDSCGFYYNNYIGLNKTSILFIENVRTGNASATGQYAGRGQRFHAPQPIEIDGIQFYGYQTKGIADSVMAIAVLYDYDSGADDVGAELARDTVWVKHAAFDPVLPNVENNASFPAVTVTQDYIVAVLTTADDSLKIYTSNPSGDGDGEGVSYALYNNEIAFPGFFQWYNTLSTFGASYDLDYLISPHVKFDLIDGYVLSNDSICPNITSAGCVSYTQLPVFADPHYNGNSGTPNANIQWLWGDGFQNTMITTACHTYSNSGIYDLTLKDSLVRHLFGSAYCPAIATQTIYVLDSAVANFSNTSAGFTATFSNTSTDYDSIAWNFGDGNTAGNIESPSNVYSALGDYDVWVYAFGPCNVDSLMQTITISDLGITTNTITVSVYPNPANDNVTVSGNFNEATITVYNVLGEVMLMRNYVTQKMTLNSESWSNGTYFIEVVTEDYKNTKKILVQH